MSWPKTHVETAHQLEAVSRLTTELEQVKRRLNQVYLDELDGTITEDFWGERAAEWQAEKARITETLARHQGADDRYLETGVRVLEVAERAPDLYLGQDAANKCRLLGFVLAGCSLRAGKITHIYRQPFDILAPTAATAGEKVPLARFESRELAGSTGRDWQLCHRTSEIGSRPPSTACSAASQIGCSHRQIGDHLSGHLEDHRTEKLIA